MSAWWREWAAARGLSEDQSHRGELCLNEVIGNIIQHGGGAVPSLTIEVTLESAAQSVHVTIADDGIPFDPVEYSMQKPRHEPGTGSSGGLGIDVTRTYASGIAYRRRDGWNVLTLIL